MRHQNFLSDFLNIANLHLDLVNVAGSAGTL